ncbi:hypothetical protein G6658_08545 [Polynucleobacter paneuropaeus]|nr:hypothetical protein G6658_08545 [Polynucleobacter paneuropaeus]
MIVNRLNLLLYISVIIFTIAGCSDNKEGIQKIEVGDVYKFGTSLLGKRVEMEGVIREAYACQISSNLGNQCLAVYKSGSESEGVTTQIRNNAYSLEQYKDWLNNKKLLRLTGKIELKMAADPDYKENTNIPTFIAEKIEAIE